MSINELNGKELSLLFHSLDRYLMDLMRHGLEDELDDEALFEKRFEEALFLYGKLLDEIQDRRRKAL